MKATEISPNVESVCPDCLKKISGKLVEDEDRIVLVKQCPDHGEFTTTIWRGEPHFSSWIRPKIPYDGGDRETVSAGCPYDCGLCLNHNQRTCTALVEITSRCNLQCPVCFADSGKPSHDPGLAEIHQMLQQIMERTGGCNLQLSGGEPTMRDDLELIVAMARDIGFTFIQLNTNGLKIAEDQNLAHRLAQAGLSSLFLQFDGVSDDVFMKLRGKALFTRKIAAIEHAAHAGLGIVLVPTLVKGINTNQLWDIVSFGLQRAPAVRGVHFQPISYFGRYPADFIPDHFTLPEVMKGLEIQSNMVVKSDDFHPPACEHALCSLSSRYLIKNDGNLRLLGSKERCNCTPIPALQGALASIDATAQQWKGDFPTHHNATDNDELSKFIRQAGNNRFQLSAMAFQDCWNLQLERLQGCCIHVAQPDGRLIPFCSFNLTSRTGKSLYRGQAEMRISKTRVDRLVEKRLNLPADWTRSDLELTQVERLRKTVAFAQKNSPYYKEKLSEFNVNEIQDIADIQKLPLLSGHELIQEGQQLQCISSSRIARIITLNTSGTTGKSKRLLFSDADLASTRDFFYHGMKNLIGADDRVLIMLPYIQPESTGELLVRALSDHGIHAEGLWPPSSAATPKIQQNGITCIVGLPQHLLKLAERLGKGYLRSMQLCSDYASPALRKRIERSTGAETYLHYGTTESGLGGGVECALHRGCHLRESDLLIEIIDPVSLKPVANGELGEIVLTTLQREAMVLLRYRTGDLARIDRSLCGCGGVTARLFDIRGRLSGCEIGKESLYTHQLDDTLFAIDNLMDYRATIHRENIDTLNIEYLVSTPSCDLSEEIARQVKSIETIRQAIKCGLLLIGNIVAVDHFPPDHTVKRTILELD